MEKRNMGKAVWIMLIGWVIIAAPYINYENGLFMIPVNENGWRHELASKLFEYLLIIIALYLPLKEQILVLICFSVLLWLDGTIKFIILMKGIAIAKEFPLEELAKCMGRVYEKYMMMHKNIMGPGSIMENLQIILNFFVYLGKKVFFLYMAKVMCEKYFEMKKKL